MASLNAGRAVTVELPDVTLESPGTSRVAR